jgi:hypothetical protein
LFGGGDRPEEENEETLFEVVEVVEFIAMMAGLSLAFRFAF